MKGNWWRILLAQNTRDKLQQTINLHVKQQISKVYPLPKFLHLVSNDYRDYIYSVHLHAFYSKHCLLTKN